MHEGHYFRRLLALAPLILAGASQAAPPFSGPEDVAFAESLWKAMGKFHMVGPNRFQSMPYQTPPPHGHMVEVLEGNINVDGRKALVIVKKNFGKTKKETRQEIADNPDAFMTSITVMFKREAGYDEDNKNWFWAKYTPNGELLKNPKGMALAGRVAKGKKGGCIACHSAAPGGDYVYIHDRYK
jgi:hypothetical protein